MYSPTRLYIGTGGRGKGSGEAALQEGPGTQGVCCFKPHKFWWPRNSHNEEEYSRKVEGDPGKILILWQKDKNVLCPESIFNNEWKKLWAALGSATALC